MELQAHTRFGRVGARHDEELVLVELRIGNRDQRLVTTAVVPAQHTLRQASSGEKAKDALYVGNLRALFLVVALCSAGHLGEELGRRELAFVADHDDLPGPSDGAKRVHGLDLRSLVHDKEVIGHLAGRQELGDRERAHHHDRLQRLDGGPRPLHELADRHVTAALGHLTPKDPYRTHAPVARRNSTVVGTHHLETRGLDALAIEVGELAHMPSVKAAVEASEFRIS